MHRATCDIMLGLPVERQAPIVHRVHLVIFSTSFQLKSINLLFHIIIQTGDYCISSYYFVAVVLEDLKSMHVSRYC